MLCDWVKANELKIRSGVSSVTRSCSLWHKLPPGFIKCNTDVAIFNDISCASISAVFRDAGGNFLAGRTYTIAGVPLVKECETIALLEAISWAVDLGFHSVIFESDAKLVVDVVHSSHDDQTEF